MPKTSYAVALERYRSLVTEFPDLQVKGKANPYTSMNGNMFSFLDKEGRLCLRLSKTDQAAFNDKFGTGPVEQYGAIMRGYVEVPAALAADTSALRGWFEKCLENAHSLPAKPTKKSK